MGEMLDATLMGPSEREFARKGTPGSEAITFRAPRFTRKTEESQTFPILRSIYPGGTGGDEKRRPREKLVEARSSLPWWSHSRSRIRERRRPSLFSTFPQLCLAPGTKQPLSLELYGHRTRFESQFREVRQRKDAGKGVAEAALSR